MAAESSCADAQSSSGDIRPDVASSLTLAESKRLQKFVKPFLDNEWTSTNGGLLRVAKCEETRTFHVSPASSQDPFPDGWSSLTLMTPPASSQDPFPDGQGSGLSLYLLHPDGSQLKFEPGESDVSKCAVWSGPAGASPMPCREEWTCKTKEQISAEEGEAQFKAGQVAMTSKFFPEAVQHFNAVVALDGCRTNAALRARAKAQLMIGALDQALADAQISVVRDEMCVDSHFTLGLVKMVANDFLGARTAYRRALDLAPELVCVSEGLCEAERLLLTAFPLETTVRTFKPNGSLSIGSVWDMIERGSASCTSLRQVGMVFQSPRSACRMPYILTVPSTVVSGAALQEKRANPTAPQRLYPLALYLHSAAFADLVKGDVQGRQLQLLAEEAPQSFLAQKGLGGSVDSFIGLAPCCPPNIGLLDPNGYSGKAVKKRKVFWFKTCDAQAYFSWNFADAQRCLEVELLVVELLRVICDELPVDPQRIYFLGSSCGGYAALRLAELLPALPAAVVPFAGYYPDMPGQDHDTLELVRRLRDVNIWPMHCKDDRLCKLELPMVARLYQLLEEEAGVSVEWVPSSVAKGSQSNYHSASNQLLKDPEVFFQKLSRFRQETMQSPITYLDRRLVELAASILPHNAAYAATGVP